ncbi:MAG TPA: aromatic ring-hydroxylating dioxygenase subunit alpha [Casimicrobiaceae bacterium]|nr:aromatic ring-hydroxylating dioxygenase subunit alpha [Casimicrobiaceae bacterium]
MTPSKTIEIARRIEESAKAVRQPLALASHVPYRLYSDPEVLELEKERLFMKDWLLVGRGEQIPNPGDYMTLDIFDEPILIVRNQQGEVHAFSNFCLHRGAEISPKGFGHVTEFACPYHNWLYDLDGKLIGAPHMRDAEGFNVRECRLPQVRLAQWGGFVFVTLDPDAVPFDQFIERFAQEFAFLHIEDCTLGARVEFDLGCNWKFVVENLFDIYHVTTIHAGTFGKYRDTLDYFTDEPGQGSLFGYYKSAPFIDGGKSLFGHMPWLADKPETFACSGFQPPNVQMFARCDALVVHTIWPVTPDRTRMLSYMMFPKIRRDDPEFDAKAQRYAVYLRKIIDEDETAIASLQRAAHSRLFRPGRMSKLEHGVYNVLNFYLNRIVPPTTSDEANAASSRG